MHIDFNQEQTYLGRNPTVIRATAILVTKGWSQDRILRNAVSKLYTPHTAVLRIDWDVMNQIGWLKGEYTSEGRNVLSTCFTILRPAFTLEETEEAIDRFLVAAEKCINESFAVRMFGEAVTS